LHGQWKFPQFAESIGSDVRIVPGALTEPAIPEIVGRVEERIGIEALMQDMRAHLEKLKSEADDCALISELAADRQKRMLFASLSRHLKRLASEVELAIQDKLEKEEG
jgi:hypothetical protein